jgi:hypothetical protein
MTVLLSSIAFTLSGIFLLSVSRELERGKSYGCLVAGAQVSAVLFGLAGMVTLGIGVLL